MSFGTTKAVYTRHRNEYLTRLRPATSKERASHRVRLVFSSSRPRASIIRLAPSSALISNILAHMESPSLPHADSDSYHSPQEYTSFASTTSSISLSEPKPKALSDPFRSENIVRDVQVRMDPPPDFLLGQLSSIPVTQTTVVTTTRYTTTSFPPLVMKAPKHLEDLDPKMYPLASSPTPPSIKRFCMDVGGVPTVFREADNATEAFGQVLMRIPRIL